MKSQICGSKIHQAKLRPNCLTLAPGQSQWTGNQEHWRPAQSQWLCLPLTPQGQTTSKSPQHSIIVSINLQKKQNNQFQHVVFTVQYISDTILQLSSKTVFLSKIYFVHHLT